LHLGCPAIFGTSRASRFHEHDFTSAI
jgi:hypothetical protein